MFYKILWHINCASNNPINCAETATATTVVIVVAANENNIIIYIIIINGRNGYASSFPKNLNYWRIEGGDGKKSRVKKRIVIIKKKKGKETRSISVSYLCKISLSQSVCNVYRYIGSQRKYDYELQNQCRPRLCIVRCIL